MPKHKLTAAKAKRILHDGSVYGHPLTKRQRGFFGRVAGRKRVRVKKHV